MTHVTGFCLLAATLALAACSPAEPPIRVEGGEPDRGEALIEAYGCGACHTIPGVRGADSPLAPPLTDFGQRVWVNGLPNAPAFLVPWIRDPREVDPDTPMPDLGVTDQEARDIAAYLYTLR